MLVLRETCRAIGHLAQRSRRQILLLHLNTCPQLLVAKRVDTRPLRRLAACGPVASLLHTHDKATNHSPPRPSSLTSRLPSSQGSFLSIVLFETISPSPPNTALVPNSPPALDNQDL